MHPAALTHDALLKNCTVTAGRSSGPGGQNRNKVETAIRITHKPTGIIGSATERRHKEQNKQQALFRLRIKLAVQVREPVDPGAKPSDCWAARAKHGKLLINPSHADYPTLLAEALDRITMVQHELSAAADLLGVSSSQLVKLIKHEPTAMSLLNDQRKAIGLHALK
ncbi:MAG: peptide chain release factor-like protein [Phycisphaeraceae bacterium]